MFHLIFIETKSIERFIPRLESTLHEITGAAWFTTSSFIESKRPIREWDRNFYQKTRWKNFKKILDLGGS